MTPSSNRLAWSVLALGLIGAVSAEAQAIRTFEIHPSIGIARVGDSTRESYLAPDWWHRDVVPAGGYRDAKGKIKRMGVRFRVYELDANGVVLGEVTADDAELVWRVHLVNKKAAKDEPFGSGTPLNLEDPATMTIDPGEQEVGLGERREVRGAIGPAGEVEVKLGDLGVTREGRLVVLGGEEYEARPAWVVVAPPDYAHPVMNMVTLTDLVRDRSDPGSAPASPSFTWDVNPILRRVPHLQWTLMAQRATRFGRTAMHAHGIEGTHPLLVGAHAMHRKRADFFEPDVFFKLRLADSADPLYGNAQGLRAHILDRLKEPSGDQSGGIGEDHSMPPLEQLTLTPTQHEILSNWRDDLFVDDWDTTWDPADPPADFEPEFSTLALAEQPAALDRAALDGGFGGPLAPGIDVGPLMAEARRRRPTMAPFTSRRTSSPVTSPKALACPGRRASTWRRVSGPRGPGRSWCSSRGTGTTSPSSGPVPTRTGCRSRAPKQRTTWSRWTTRRSTPTSGWSTTG
ncbi:MAG: LodA/GoxA family CTQ-dependent oxidase [Planctomycetota bacterium]|jgi:hypothetical protein